MQDATAPSGPCDFASVGLVTDSTSSTYHAAQALSHGGSASGLGFLASYTFSKSLDYVSSFNVAGSAPQTGSRRKRPRAESVRPECGARAVAVRRAPPLRVQRQLRTAVGRIAVEHHCELFFEHAVHGIRQRERCAPGQLAGDHGILLQPAGPDRRPERGAAHGGPVGERRGVPAPGSRIRRRGSSAAKAATRCAGRASPIWTFRC